MSCCSQEKENAFTIIEPKNKAKPGVLSAAKSYQPLIVMVLAVAIGTMALAFGLGLDWMPLFMGLFLLNFAMFKFFDLDGFAKSFAMYDVIGKRSSLYAKAYPFIELMLAIGFLAQLYLPVINVLTAIIMTVGLIGIVQNFRSGQKIRCACMGSLINVPVGSITILENTSMIAMALSSLFAHQYLSF